MVRGASGWSGDDWCWCCCASWGVGGDWVFVFCGGDDDLCWMISSRRLVTTSFERGLVVAVDAVGNVGDVDVLSIAVGPKCGLYKLGVEGESVNKCNKDLEGVSICAVKPDEDGSFVASKVKDDSAG